MSIFCYFQRALVYCTLRITREFLESDCLRQLKLNNGRALDALFRHYSSPVYRLLTATYKSRVEAGEIVQDCFRKIWEKRQQLQKGTPLKGYLFTTAHHAILSQLRRSQH